MASRDFQQGEGPTLAGAFGQAPGPKGDYSTALETCAAAGPQQSGNTTQQPFRDLSIQI